MVIIWEGDDFKDDFKIFYKEFYDYVLKFVNVLKDEGVKKGDCVIIYMLMILEVIYVMLVCVWIGVVYFVVFGGFLLDSLVGCIFDCDFMCVIILDEGVWGGKLILFKVNIDVVFNDCLDVLFVVVVRRIGVDVFMKVGWDVWYYEKMVSVFFECLFEEMNVEDLFFILYIFGLMGKFKGVMYIIGGYFVYVFMIY